MKHNQYKFKTKIWLYSGKAAWYFISLPKDISAEISERFSDIKRGWGSLKVAVTIGSTTWLTSIFPDAKSKSYLLPLKAEVRNIEGLKEGSTVNVFIEVEV